MTQKNTTVVGHPLVQHKLSIMPDISTPTEKFRKLLREISLLLAYEVCSDLETEQIDIQTPLETAKMPKLEGKKLCFISILRAGNGLVDGMLDLVPSARVGHVGVYRDPKTLVPIEYYLKLPDRLDERLSIVVDPMLATGNSAAAAVQRAAHRHGVPREGARRRRRGRRGRRRGDVHEREAGDGIHDARRRAEGLMRCCG